MCALQSFLRHHTSTNTSTNTQEEIPLNKVSVPSRITSLLGSPQLTPTFLYTCGTENMKFPRRLPIFSAPFFYLNMNLNLIISMN